MPCWFPTRIYPDKEKIHVCSKWINKYGSNIDFQKPGIITNLKKQATSFVFKWSDGRWFIHSGIMVARVNGFVKPTDVILFYKEENNFKIWVDKGKSIASVPPTPPSAKVNVPEVRAKASKHFKTTIYPDKNAIKVCPEFLNHWYKELDFEESGCIIDAATNKSTAVKFKPKDGLWFLSSGRRVAMNNGITKPKIIVLYFEGHVNRFSMYPAYGENMTPTPTNDDPIVISSDEDMIPEEHGDVINEPQHFPNKTSMYVLRDKQTMIRLRDLATGRIYRCTIITSGRYTHEKYLGKGWYDFKFDKDLRVGDTLRCELDEDARFMNVEVIRNRRRRR
ncbi:unnamed protein product [Trifolium pratense]|uniref:Uncharacterized protein n=1 Tax=Trifolium pratense TaxID=57577 RepID=A0ACB0K6J2_TRIPR|nr:unnamed protein product [Trifolium pratense]